MGKFDKLLQLLIEQLSDVEKSEVVHYTNYVGLYGILKKRKILAKDYATKSVSKRNNLEVASIRRSADYTLRKENDFSKLTTNVDGVKIYLFNKDIISSVRGVSKKPIAEFPIYYKNELDRDLNNFIANKLKGIKISKQTLKDFLKEELYKINKKGISPEDILALKEESSYLNDTYKNFYILTGKKADDYFLRYDLLSMIKNYAYIEFASTLGREGEERFLFKNLKDKKKEIGIPISPKYMRIEIFNEPDPKQIMNDFEEEFDEYDKSEAYRKIKEFYELVLYHNNLFLKKDSKYNEFIKVLETLVKSIITEEVNADPEVSKSEVVHYTNIEGLHGILKSGFIHPNRYSVDALTDVNKESDPWTIHTKREIATLRRGIAKEYTSLKKQNKDRYESNLSSLTSNAGKIKIYLFNKNITSKLRGVTKRPIAEFGKGSLQTFNDGVESLYVALSKTNEKLKYDDLKKYLKKMGREISNWSIENSNTYVKSNAPIVKEKIDKMIIDLNLDASKIEHQETDLYGRVFHLINNLIFFYTGKTREGEERLTFKNRKIEGIPVSPEFMKIKITDPITVKEIDNALFYSKERDIYLDKLEGFKDSLIKYKDSFIINSHYNELLSAIDEDIDKTRKRK